METIVSLDEIEEMAKSMPNFSKYMNERLNGNYFDPFRDRLMNLFENLGAKGLKKGEGYLHMSGFTFDPKKSNSFRLGELGKCLELEVSEIDKIYIKVGWDMELDYEGGTEHPEIILFYGGDRADKYSELMLRGVSEWKEIVNECFDVSRMCRKNPKIKYSQNPLDSYFEKI